MVTCPIADRETQGRYYCTREAGHKGPCAAVPRSLTDQALMQARNEGLSGALTSDDLKTVDAQVGYTKSWRNGYGLTVWAKAKFGAGRKGANPTVGVTFGKHENDSTP